jgi:DNA ligase-associated metallophosphoesterase
MEFVHGHNTFRLLPEKALFWENNRSLIVSDLHVGKIGHFRKSGIAVPTAGVVENLNKLSRLAERLNPEQLIFTGDLFHSDKNREWDAFFSWRSNLSALRMTLVRGNHDLIDTKTASDNYIQLIENEIIGDSVVLGHHPRSTPVDGILHIAGHIHPVVTLRHKALHNMRVPCFLIKPDQLILPAFGYFTGGFSVEPRPDERAVLIVNNQLIEFSRARYTLPISKK